MYRARIAVLLACVSMVGSSSLYAEEVSFTDDNGCLAGDVPITSETRAAARAAGYPDEVTCWKPSDENIGMAAGTAKVYLRSILCASDGDNYGGMGADGTIEALDAKFAQCAATFLKELNRTGSSFCIREGARSEAKQREYVARGLIACTHGKQCEHPRGIALDINPLSGSAVSCESYRRAHQLAPQFGLTFYMGCRDAVHFVPMKSGCTAGGSPNTNASAPLPITAYDFEQYAPTVNPFQNANIPFIMPPMQQQYSAPQRAPYMPTSPTIAPAPTLPSTTLSPTLPTIPSTPSATPSTPLHTPTSAPTTPVTLPSTPSQSASSTRSIVTPAAGVPTEAPRPSWINVILGIAEFESAPITESEPTQERSIGDGISHLSSDGNPAARSDTASPLSPRPPAALQTFTSDDLRFTPSPETVAARLETARTLSALGQLRAGLERFLGVQNPPRAMQNAARWYPS